MKHEEWKPPKCYYDSEDPIVQELISILNPKQRKEFTKDFRSDKLNSPHNISKYKTFDCSIMDIADDISNAIHDLEDVIYLNQIDKAKFIDGVESLKLSQEDRRYFQRILNDRDDNINFNDLISNLFNSEKNKQAIGDLVYLCVNSCEIKKNDSLDCDEIFQYNVKLSEHSEKIVTFLKDYIVENVIKSPNVQTIVHGGMMVIMRLFDAYDNNPEELLSPEWYKIYKNKNEEEKKRIICNFIAGMTDAYAYRIYSRLYGHNSCNMFDKI